MSLHFVSHQWQVKDVEDGILVALTCRDLDAMTVPVLVDELHELVLESGLPNLWLDFTDVQFLASIVMGKMIAIDQRLHRHGGKLILCNVNPDLYGILAAARITDLLDIRAQSALPELAHHRWDFSHS